MSVKVLVNFHLGTDVRVSVSEDTLTTLRRRFPGTTFAPADDRDTLAREAADAEVFYGFEFPADLVPAAPRLRWIQSISAGIERNLATPITERGILVTNGAGIASTGIAEHAIAVMLAFCRNHHVAARLQHQGRWDRPAVMAGTGFDALMIRVRDDVRHHVKEEEKRSGISIGTCRQAAQQ